MLSELLKSALTLVAAFVVQWFFALINVEISPEVFNAIVAGIVVWLLKQLGYELLVAGILRVFPDAVKRGLLKDD